MQQKITMELLQKLENDFSSQRTNRIAMNAVVNNGIKVTAQNAECLRTTVHEFSIRLNQGEITAQKKSGRCWMFAALNTMRFQVIKKLNLDTFELSQNYTLFYDKLEKTNYFLENILETLDEPTDGRLISYLLSDPMSDGGQWDMFCNLIEKYGVVPKSAMPETVVSSDTGEMDGILTEKLRGYACTLRKMYADGKNMEELRSAKEKMVKSMYNILCICLGIPPKKVNLEVRDKENRYIRDMDLTPKEFYEKYVGMDLSNYVGLINAPTADKPYYKSYTVQYLGNVKEGHPVHYVNLPSEELKKAAIAQLKDGEPVWFGCDVGQSYSRNYGLLDLNLYHLEELFDTEFDMNKAERLDYGQSRMTHAMVFQGVDLDEEGKSVRWCVENSWGKEPGKDGYFVMTDEWFDEFNYQVVVHKKYLSDKAKKAYEEEPITLKPWDPMGSLA